jgi:hypothetical protein
MTTSIYDLEVNPFEDDVVRQPRDVIFSVSGLNDNQLRDLISSFQKLEKGELPRRPVDACKVQLVISPSQGYGKSHLLGRLFRSLGSRATQVYLRPFQDPYKAWHSILLLTIQELERPNESPLSFYSQLEAIAISVLFHLAADLLITGAFPDYQDAANAASLLRRFATDPTALSEKDAPWIEWLKALIDEPNPQLASMFSVHGISFAGREQAWLKVLAAQAFTKPFSPAREAALKWIRAEPLETEEVASLGITGADNEGRGDSYAQEINDLSFKRLRGLCSLSSYYRPFLFCFDQTEFFASDPLLVKALGNCIDKLFVEVPNQMTVITANHGNWRNDILPNIDQPQRNRISPEIRMDGIGAKGAAELINERLGEYDLSSENAEQFFAGGWLESVFEQARELGVRAVLMRAADRFRALGKPQPPPPPQTLADLFQLEVNDVRSKKALLAYNQDALMWFVKDIAQGHSGVSIMRPSNCKYFSIAWEWPDRSVCFAFEGGDNSQRWRGIANEAIKTAKGRGGRAALSYVLRTPDLAKVPRPTWIAIGQVVHEATKQGFHIFQLSVERVCELHAARELYSDAMQGNITHSGPETLNWLRDHFRPFLRELAFRKPELEAAYRRGKDGQSRTSKEASTAKIHSEKQRGCPDELEASRLRVVVDTVREMRLVDIKVVLARLGNDDLQDPLLRSVEAHPNLKAHPGPQTIFLQWRITP